MSDSCALSILLPVRNEGINLPMLIKVLTVSFEVEYEVLVICDDHEDDSIPVIEELNKKLPNVRLIVNEKGRGVKNAIDVGVINSRSEIILIFAADELGPVLSLETMLELIEEGCDFVNCTRYAHGGRRLGGSWIGGILSRIANKLFHFVARSPFSDSTTGLKLFKKEHYFHMDLKSKPVGWAVAFEMSIKAQQLNLQLGEVPVISVDRLFGGESTFKLGPWVWEYSKWFVFGFMNSRKISDNQRKNIRVKKPEFL